MNPFLEMKEEITLTIRFTVDLPHEFGGTRVEDFCMQNYPIIVLNGSKARDTTNSRKKKWIFTTRGMTTDRTTKWDKSEAHRMNSHIIFAMANFIVLHDPGSSITAMFQQNLRPQISSDRKRRDVSEACKLT